MNKTRPIRLGIPALIAILAIAGPAAAAPLPVSGSGQILFGSSRERVTIAPVGPTGGEMLVVDHTVLGTVVLRVDVNCVRIVGSEATVSGIITSSNDPTLVGFEALVQIVDSGTGGSQDLMSPVLLHEVGIGPDCTVPSEFDLVEVQGNFTIAS